MIEQAHELQHWKLHNEFSLHEAALLWLNFDPVVTNTAKLKEINSKYVVVSEALVKAFAEGVLEGRCAADKDGNLLLDEEHETYIAIARESLARWALAKGESPSFLHDDILRLKNESQTGSDRPLPLPCPDHIAPWVRLLLQGYEKYWLDFNPDDRSKKAPANPDVIKWFDERLVRKNPDTGEEVRVTNDVAKVFARLIRPDGAPTGRRKDTEAERRENHGYDLKEIESLETR